MKIALGELVRLAGEWGPQFRDIYHAIQAQTDLQKSIYEDEKDRKYFDDLSMMYLEYVIDRIEKKKGGLLNDAYKWIFDTEQYATFTDLNDDKSDF